MDGQMTVIGSRTKVNSMAKRKALKNAQNKDGGGYCSHIIASVLYPPHVATGIVISKNLPGLKSLGRFFLYTRVESVIFELRSRQNALTE